ncbi:ABC transporter permease [Calidifontibacillus erzurumensis]|uniref:ABC transporter permease n=1 Tax=Calidifontibacillus erzurumensis TaxID=2741433 RepID=A0A8J8GH34_9BACI|nr:ABC transporter permease [Calidifontibacillus erzurumensis]NSL51661.1 ABC transporter permease [Calidifontibacillus erzurumensis]
MKMLLIAKHELKIISRSKWVLSFTILYTALAITIVLFGGSAEEAGFNGFNRMAASLLNLSLFLVPLLTLLIGSTSLAGDKEDGSLSLITTYPIHAWEIILGKFAGLFVSLFAIITFGYGTAGLILFFSKANVSLQFFLIFYGFTMLLMVMFLGLSMLIGSISTTRFQALGFSLILWAVSVLFYEFIVIGLAMVINKQAILGMFTASILMNPVELIRVWTIISMDSGSIFGPHLYDLTIWSEGMIGQLVFALTALVWVALPLIFTNQLLKRGLRHGT